MLFPPQDPSAWSQSAVIVDGESIPDAVAYPILGFLTLIVVAMLWQRFDTQRPRRQGAIRLQPPPQPRPRRPRQTGPTRPQLQPPWKALAWCLSICLLSPLVPLLAEMLQALGSPFDGSSGSADPESDGAMLVLLGWLLAAAIVLTAAPLRRAFDRLVLAVLDYWDTGAGPESTATT